MIYFCEDVLRLIKDFNLRNKSELKIRIGVHCGPVVAGIIGNMQSESSINPRTLAKR